MKEILIVGAGGFGRETFYTIKAINAVHPTWIIKGFLNDDANALDGINIDCRIVGTIKDWIPSENEVFALGISSPAGKEKVTNLLKSRGARFETIIHPRADINDTAVLGEGCFVGGRTSIGDCARIGSFVNLQGSMVGQDAVIGDFSTTTGYANITNAHLGKRVFVGSHAVILNNKRIGDDAFICAGSIVIANVKPNTKVMGNPARKVDFSL